MANSSLGQLNKKQNIAKWVFLVLTIGLSLFLIINGAIGGEGSAAESDAISKAEADIINAIIPGTIPPESFSQFAAINRKIVGHFLAFTVDAIFATLASYYFLITRKWYKPYLIFIISFGFGLFVALLSELLQLFTPGRVGSFKDVGIDMGGYALGLLIIFIILFLAKKLNFERQTSLAK